MTDKARREAAKKWLEDNQDMSAAEIRLLSKKFLFNLAINPHFRGVEKAGSKVCDLLDTAARIKAREEKKSR